MKNASLFFSDVKNFISKCIDKITVIMFILFFLNTALNVFLHTKITLQLDNIKKDSFVLDKQIK